MGLVTSGAGVGQVQIIQQPAWKFHIRQQDVPCSGGSTSHRIVPEIACSAPLLHGCNGAAHATKHYTVDDKPGKETLDSRCLESQRAFPILMPQNDRLSHLQSRSHVKSSHRGRNL